MTLLHQAAQKAVEVLKLAHHGMIPGLALDKRTAAAIAQLEFALQHQEVPREPVAEVLSYTNGSYSRNYKLRWIKDVPEGTKLYASPSTTRQQEVGSTAARDVLAERARQISAEGWTAEHDDEHGDGQLAFAAACYAKHASARAWMFGSLDDAAERYAADDSPDDWPDSWDTSWWRPKNPRRDLVRAAALLLAEIERMDRAAAPSTPEKAGGVSEQPKEADRG